MGWEAQTGICQCSVLTFKHSRGCTHCLGHVGVESSTDPGWQTKPAITSGWHIRRAEVLGSLRHYLRTQSQGHHAIDRLEERCVEGGRDRRSSFEQRQHWENIPETRWSVYEPSRERRSYLGNCSELPYNVKEEWKVQTGNISQINLLPPEDLLP